jgi:hypothetical protein
MMGYSFLEKSLSMRQVLQERVYQWENFQLHNLFKQKMKMFGLFKGLKYLRPEKKVE